MCQSFQNVGQVLFPNQSFLLTILHDVWALSFNVSITHLILVYCIKYGIGFDHNLHFQFTLLCHLLKWFHHTQVTVYHVYSCHQIEIYFWCRETPSKINQWSPCWPSFFNFEVFCASPVYWFTLDTSKLLSHGAGARYGVVFQGLFVYGVGVLSHPHLSLLMLQTFSSFFSVIKFA